MTDSQGATIVAALADHLQSKPWDAFLTTTFRQPRTPQQAEVEFQRIESALAHVSHGFLASELHLDKYDPEPHTTWDGQPMTTPYRIHVHGLLKWDAFIAEYGVTEVDRTLARETAKLLNWGVAWKRFGRTSIAKIDEVGGAVGYVTKYCTKALTAWWMW